jgi:hypothetical protein
MSTKNTTPMSKTKTTSTTEISKWDRGDGFCTVKDDTKQIKLSSKQIKSEYSKVTTAPKYK